MIKVRKQRRRKIKNLKKKTLDDYKHIIICPFDGERHIDTGKFAFTPHKRHLCVRTDSRTGKKVKHFFTVSKKSIGI